MNIKITNIYELLFTVFVSVCAGAGFIEFPARVITYLWNFVSKYVAIPTIDVWQGLLLWIIIALLVFISNKAYARIAVAKPRELTDYEMDELLYRIKTRQIKPMIIDTDGIEKIKNMYVDNSDLNTKDNQKSSTNVKENHS